MRPDFRGRTLVFENAIKQDGVFSPGDYESFQFNSLQAFRPYVKALEDAGLLVSTHDEGDKRRKTIQVTALGWLVKFAMEQSQLSQNAIQQDP
ncbi:MAG: hypothetical protein FJ083_14125 [Cyanobacteria bacterium K_Offshore_surface_m2_239]|nr:hypothetical protein [Cyanobacteria bacterium K_Offshore_surface_m2_239]